MSDPVVLPEAMRWFMDQFRPPKEVMYHYTTSWKALKNIVEHRRMWATDLRAMNDPKELLFGKALIDQRIVKAVRKAPNPLRARWFESVREQFRKLIVRRSSSFAISFSEYGDLPNQWRDYADNGQGFVLGWSLDSTYPETPLPMWVTYDRVRQKALIDGTMQFHIDYITRAVAGNAEASVTAWSEAGLSLGVLLNVIRQTFKQAKWSIESEFRFVYPFFDGFVPPEQIFQSRVVNGVQKPYIEADFSQAALRCIVVGPRNDLPSTLSCLRELLDHNGFQETQILRSAVRTDQL